jgi:hypothetical protein
MGSDARMRSIQWQGLGFSDVESQGLAGLRRSEASFTLSHELALWTQWVHELELGSLWTPDELESAWATREDLDESVRTIVPTEYLDRFFAYLDVLDQTFRSLTVPTAIGETSRLSWWRGRIPIRNAQRKYLLEDE